MASLAEILLLDKIVIIMIWILMINNDLEEE